MLMGAEVTLAALTAVPALASLPVAPVVNVKGPSASERRSAARGRSDLRSGGARRDAYQLDLRRRGLSVVAQRDRDVDGVAQVRERWRGGHRGDGEGRRLLHRGRPRGRRGRGHGGARVRVGAGGGSGEGEAPAPGP